MAETPRRARTDAAPELRAEVEAFLHDTVRPQLYARAEQLGLEGGDRSAWVAAACVLLESGMLTDVVARSSAIGAEYRWGRAEGLSAQAAHTRLGEKLGMTRQGLESRLSLTGSNPGRRNTIPADILRASIYKAFEREPSLAETVAMEIGIPEHWDAPNGA